MGTFIISCSDSLGGQMITVISHPQYGTQEVVSKAALDLYIADGWIVKERKGFKDLPELIENVTTELNEIAKRKRGRPFKNEKQKNADETR